MRKSSMIQYASVLAMSAAVTLLAPTAASAGSCDCSVVPTLGRAHPFPAFAISGGQVYLQGSAFAENGNIGVGPGASAKLTGAAGIDGFIAHHPGTTVIGGGAAAGGVIEQDMSGPVADAKQASLDFAAMTPTQTFGEISSNTTITGNGCINVIQVNGDIDLRGDVNLTLQGGATDYFIINVEGKIETRGTADLIHDGMEPNQVLYNITKAGEPVLLGGNSGGNGTFLNVAGLIYLHGNSGGRGGYIGATADVHFQGNADFFGKVFECVNLSCPDPELGGVNIQTPATPPARSLGNTSYFFAYFDPVTFEGHLELFKVAPDGTLKDSADNDAVDPVTKLLKSTRAPFWDAGAVLRVDTSRSIHTTDASGDTVAFNGTNVSEDDLTLEDGEVSSYPNHPGSGVTDKGKLHSALMGYVHGKDGFDEDTDTISTEMRDAVLGDIFHSNPILIGSPVSYLAHEEGYAGFAQTYAQRDRVVYAGANDGMFHAFDAGAYWDPHDATAFNSGTGAERFGYVPRLLQPTVKNTAKTIDRSDDRLAPAFVDGNSVAADAWLGDGSGSDVSKAATEWATVLIAAFRDGGAGYIALDITDPDAVSGDAHGPYPQKLWEFTHANLGHSWSRPVISRVKLAGASSSGDHCGRDDGDVDCREQWVAIFGGGFALAADPNEDLYISNPASLAWSDTSKSIFMVALDSGEVLASVEFDAAGLAGPARMKSAIPSPPAVLDIDHDGFADVVYIGDTAGQMWKWDVSALGVDSAGDSRIDNWASGVFFRSAVTVTSDGDRHHRPMHFPLAASMVHGNLVLAFSTGERNDLLYEGDSGTDENNRLYVVKDPHPTGGSAFGAVLTEANLTNVTSSAVYTPPVLGNHGYYIVGSEGEKFVSDMIIFADYVLAVSFTPSPFPTCGPGDATFYAFSLRNGAGFFDSNGTPEAADRKMVIGAGVPSNPRVTLGADPTDDVVFVTTSEGQILSIEPPLRDEPESSVVYWKQVF